MAQTRPKYLNLLQIRLPLPGFVSILHRISGALLFVLIPFGLYVLQASLESAQRYAALKGAFAHPFVKLVVVGAAWAYLHHLCAGLRFLAIDLGYGTDLARARAGAAAVLVVSVVLTLGLAWWLW